MGGGSIYQRAAPAHAMIHGIYLIMSESRAGGPRDMTSSTAGDGAAGVDGAGSQGSRDRVYPRGTNKAAPHEKVVHQALNWGER